jgi:hypothetical protein
MYWFQKRLFWLSLPAKAHKGLVTVDEKKINKTNCCSMAGVCDSSILNVKKSRTFSVRADDKSISASEVCFLLTLPK